MSRNESFDSMSVIKSFGCDNCGARVETAPPDDGTQRPPMKWSYLGAMRTGVDSSDGA